MKSDSIHHFFGNAYTKSGPLRFPNFRSLTDFFCLLNYEFCLSLWKITRCSVILLLPFFENETELLIYRSFQINIKNQTFWYLLSDQIDQTELEIVNFINICSEN